MLIKGYQKLGVMSIKLDNLLIKSLTKLIFSVIIGLYLKDFTNMFKIEENE